MLPHSDRDSDRWGAAADDNYGSTGMGRVRLKKHSPNIRMENIKTPTGLPLRRLFNILEVLSLAPNFLKARDEFFDFLFQAEAKVIILCIDDLDD